MAAALAHRGPDGEGFYLHPEVGLAHRRLSIIDLAGGAQPMTNETGTLRLVFNGEIYNYQELTRALEARGHRFATRSDTETILHLYEDHGLDFAQHLRGMFAIALWDASRSRLVLVRDRIGEKPLYYAVDGDRLHFGSEIKAILSARASRRVDARAVCEFLAAGFVPAPRTFFDGIRKLAPGTMLVWEKGQASVTRYWQRSASESQASFARSCRDLRGLLQETIRLCLKSDVEVGAFLSGGIDSSLIVALMREVNTQVRTFSVGYGGAAAGFNELHYARHVAGLLGTKHHELILDAHSSVHLLPRVLYHYDEPHGEPTSVLVYLLCEFTRRSLTVALGGTGGDELFFGYPRHKGIRWLAYYHLLPQRLRRDVVERLVARWPESTQGSRFAKRAKRFVKGASLPPPDAYLSWVSLLSRETRDQLLSDGIKCHSEDPSGEQFMRDYLTAPGNGELLRRAESFDLAGYLPEYQLTYMDRMSMAHGLEVRSPLCDYRLVEFATALPTAYRLRGQRSKHILKDAGRQWLPRAITERRKVGFDSPIGQWFKDELRPFLNEFLSAANLRQSGLLNPAAVHTLVGEHQAGARDYSLQLWSLVALEAWYRMYIEGGIRSEAEARLEHLRGHPQTRSVQPTGVSAV